VALLFTDIGGSTRLLERCRKHDGLVTLTGGSGKTRLAPGATASLVRARSPPSTT
jgi:hypothetical protein